MGLPTGGPWVPWVTYGLRTETQRMGPMETHGLPMGYPRIIRTAVPHYIEQNHTQVSDCVQNEKKRRGLSSFVLVVCDVFIKIAT